MGSCLDFCVVQKRNGKVHFIFHMSCTALSCNQGKFWSWITMKLYFEKVYLWFGKWYQKMPPLHISASVVTLIWIWRQNFPLLTMQNGYFFPFLSIKSHKIILNIKPTCVLDSGHRDWNDARCTAVSSTDSSESDVKNWTILPDFCTAIPPGEMTSGWIKLNSQKYVHFYWNSNMLNFSENRYITLKRSPK